MSKTQSRYEDQLDWKDHAVNLSTEKRVIAARYGNAFIYRVDGKTYRDFPAAVLATEPYGNAAGAIIVMCAKWGSAKDKPYLVYSPKGGSLGKFASLSEVADQAKKFEMQFPPLSEGKIKRRKEAFLQAKKDREAAAKRRLIEREKEKILAKRRAEAERAEFEEKYGEDVGSW